MEEGGEEEETTDAEHDDVSDRRVSITCALCVGLREEMESTCPLPNMEDRKSAVAGEG